MRGTTRPSDYQRADDDAPARKPLRATLKHGDRFGPLRVEGVPFRNARGKLCINLRCVECGTPRVVYVYHLAQSTNPTCAACGRKKRWNCAPACGPRKPSGPEGSKP